MAKKRWRMSKRQSRKNYQRGFKQHPANKVTTVSRGGIRK